MAEAEEYENRVVAYGDVLGWSKACEKSVDDKETMNKLLNATSKIKRYAEKFSLRIKEVTRKQKALHKKTKKDSVASTFFFFRQLCRFHTHRIRERCS